MLISEICTYGYAKQQQRTIGVPYNVSAIVCEKMKWVQQMVFFPQKLYKSKIKVICTSLVYVQWINKSAKHQIPILKTVGRVVRIIEVPFARHPPVIFTIFITGSFL